VDSGREVLAFGDEVEFLNAAAFSSSGQYLAINNSHGAVEVYDMAAEPIERVAVLRADDLGSPVIFGPGDLSGTVLAGGTPDGQVWVYDMAEAAEGSSEEPALRFHRRVHTGPVVPAVSGQGLLATTVAAAPMRLWDLDSGRLVAELPTDFVGWPTVAFSPDGSYLLYGDTDGVLRRYYVDTERLVELAESRLTRGFTADECRQYLDPSRCEELGLAG
jgi:WD40 repeat protein